MEVDVTELIKEGNSDCALIDNEDYIYCYDGLNFDSKEITIEKRRCCKMNRLVYFKDLLEEDAEAQYGILVDDDYIICLCCLGVVENGDYEIIKDDVKLDVSSIIKKEVL